MPKIHRYVFKTPVSYQQKYPRGPQLAAFYAPSQEEAVRYFKEYYSDLGCEDLEGNPVLVERGHW